MSFGLTTKRIQFFGLIILSISLTGLTADFAQATGGSWGSSQGGYASSGGWSCTGSTLYRRAPVRNLLGRLNSRVSNFVCGSSGGYVGGSNGGYVGGRLCGGLFGYRGVWVSPGGYTNGGSLSCCTGFTFDGSASCYQAPGNYMMETSYPVGDYGFQPGYPTQAVPGTIPMDTAPIPDGGSIQSMLEGGGATSPLIENGEKSPEYYKQGQPETGQPKAESPGNEPKPLGPEEDTTSISPDDSKAVLNVIVPRQAKILINGTPTTTPGKFRSYVSSKLTKDQDYEYEVKAILVEDGKQKVRTELVSIRSGINKTVKFDFSEPVTSLAIRVPTDAKVSICGQEMKQTGSLRNFTTNRLKSGKVWKDYQVRVEYSVNGKKQVEEKTLDLRAGESYELSIGAASSPELIASR